MCEDCGCGDPEIVAIDVQKSVLAKNDATARHNREHFTEAGVLALNVMGSPGSGKTAVLEATAAARPRWRMRAVSADLATDRDAQRLSRAGLPSESITTGSACHLDARMLHDALHGTDWREADVFFIENVGNLVCPAVYDLGQHANVVVLSVTEGVDKPLKYPVMFRKADLVLVTKTDLLPHLPGVDLRELEDALAHVMPSPALLHLSATRGEGLDRWLEWIDLRRAALPERSYGPSGTAREGDAHG